ncbi:DUF663-domain-containing protein [Wallemia mellicola]|uniref:DUF663-domain-containing protein n=22 Tax=Wallemia TaxID=148959 RepID=A0A4T0MDQ7_9BASI|nr:DUF663-domain-containing protein [Wallemia mellicola]
MSTHSHRPSLKQTNKKFKSRGSTKRSTKTQNKGRVDTKQSSSKTSSANNLKNKQERKNQAKQLQKQKRDGLLEGKRLFEGRFGAPRIVLVLPLTEDIDGLNTVKQLLKSVGEESSALEYQGFGIYRCRISRFNQQFQFIVPTFPDNNAKFMAILDAAKIADYIIPVLSAINEVVFGIIQGLSEVEKKEDTGIRHSLLSFIRYFFPYVQKLSSVDQLNELSNTIRSIATEQAEWDGDLLKLTGVVRGEHLDTNRLIHIPNSGDYQIEKITNSTHPSQLNSKPNGNTMSVDEVDTGVLAQPDEEEQDDLISENEADTIGNEQTWPTEEEMAEGERLQEEAEAAEENAKSRKVPKGTSSYQAAWIVDDNDDDLSDDEESDEEAEMELEDDKPAAQEEEEDQDEIEMDTRDNDFEDLDEDEEAKQYQEYLNKEKEDAEFPDEIDTPLDIPARERFARYRGLKSFRTSPWDPYENLPIEMSKVFEFENYDQMSKRVIKRVKMGMDEDGESTSVEPGKRVTLHIKNVSKDLSVIQSSELPLVIFSLLPHEKKKSLVNMTIQRNTEYTGLVKSKDPLTAIIGSRKLQINPIYSQNTPKGLNNVHKFERYLRHGDASVATIFGPVTWGKVPIVYLRERDDGKPPYLVGTGTFKDADPTRIIAKRIILSGHPFKVHKKTVTVRYLFFNPDDIAYFKPIELHTKYGRVGHIKESLGTHGYFKAHFDGPVTQMDTVLLYLYKRSFPKFSGLRIEGHQHINKDDPIEEAKGDEKHATLSRYSCSFDKRCADVERPTAASSGVSSVHSAKMVSKFATPGLFTGSNVIPLDESVTADLIFDDISLSVSVIIILEFGNGCDFDILDNGSRKFEILDAGA